MFKKCCDKEKKKCLDMYQTYCIICSKKLGIEFDREDSGMLFTHIIRKYLSEDEDEIRILMENNEK